VSKTRVLVQGCLGFGICALRSTRAPDRIRRLNASGFVDLVDTLGEVKTADSDCMNSDNRIAPRHVFETRILIRLRRGSSNMAVHGWVRDLSVSGLGAFVAEQLLVGETVTLLLSLPTSGKQEIPARVARQLGTQYGFQFTGLSKEQRAAIRAALGRQPAIPYSDGQNESR